MCLYFISDIKSDKKKKQSNHDYFLDRYYTYPIRLELMTSWLTVKRSTYWATDTKCKLATRSTCRICIYIYYSTVICFGNILLKLNQNKNKVCSLFHKLIKTDIKFSNNLPSIHLFYFSLGWRAYINVISSFFSSSLPRRPS